VVWFINTNAVSCVVSRLRPALFLHPVPDAGGLQGSMTAPAEPSRPSLQHLPLMESATDYFGPLPVPQRGGGGGRPESWIWSQNCTATLAAHHRSHPPGSARRFFANDGRRTITPSRASAPVPHPSVGRATPPSGPTTLQCHPQPSRTINMAPRASSVSFVYATFARRAPRDIGSQHNGRALNLDGGTSTSER